MTKVADKLNDVAVKVTPELTKEIRVNVAIDLVAMVKLRWQKEGKSSTGSVLRYRSAEYKKYRQQKGAQITFKDFMLTGAMWRGVKVKSVRPVGSGRIEIVYGPTDTETADKIRGHNARESTNILWPSANELLFVRDSVKKYVLEQFRRAARG